MSPVASLVLTRLSPSEPPGRVSVLIVIPGLAAWKAAMMAFALATSVSPFPVRKVISVAAALPSALTAAEASGATAGEQHRRRRAGSHQRYAAPGRSS